MTLCISYQFKSPNDKIPRAICYSDSRITVLGRNTEEAPTQTFLQSNAKIKHQTDQGIKIQIVSATKVEGEESTHDFVFSIAGAVSLGLQSLIHLDSVFKTFYEKCSFNEYMDQIEKTLNEFWKDAWDKDIEYLITTVDDQNEVTIIHVKGTEKSTNLVFKKVEKQHGILFKVIGDQSEEAHEMILSETDRLFSYEKYDISSALDIACLRMMRRAIEDQNQIFIGGNIQSCILVGSHAQYTALDDGNNLLFRGVRYPRGHHEYPRKLNQILDKDPFIVSQIDQDIFDPKTNIGDIKSRKIYGQLNQSPD